MRIGFVDLAGGAGPNILFDIAVEGGATVRSVVARLHQAVDGGVIAAVTTRSSVVRLEDDVAAQCRIVGHNNCATFSYPKTLMRKHTGLLA